jgi:hypothetical protein
MKLRELTEPYIAADRTADVERARIRAQIATRERQIERLGKKYDRIPCVSWIDELVKPIADELLLLLPDCDAYEILGPLGICATVSIHFRWNGTDIQADREKYFRTLKSITFVPGDLRTGELRWRDYSKDSGEFSVNTIGEVNGMNHPDIPIDPDSDIAALLAIVNRPRE